MTSDGTWPPLPEPGHLAELPLTAPPALLEAFDYRGDNQYVAIYRGPAGVVWLDDGASRDEGDLLAWHRLTTHPITEPLTGYDFGGAGRNATTWLLVDRHTNNLRIGRPDDVAEILAAQPHTRGRLTNNLAAPRTQASVVHPEVRAAWAPTGSDWYLEASRHGYALDAVTDALDRVQARALVDGIAALSARVAGQINDLSTSSSPSTAASLPDLSPGLPIQARSVDQVEPTSVERGAATHDIEL